MSPRLVVSEKPVTELPPRAPGEKAPVPRWGTATNTSAPQASRAPVRASAGRPYRNRAGAADSRTGRVASPAAAGWAVQAIWAWVTASSQATSDSTNDRPVVRAADSTICSSDTSSTCRSSERVRKLSSLYTVMKTMSTRDAVSGLWRHTSRSIA